MLVPQNKLLKSLPADDLDRLKPHLMPVTLEFKQHLVKFDQPIKYVYFLENAITSTVVHTREGNTIEVGLMGAEGFVGLSLLFGVNRSNGTVMVQLPGTALRMRVDHFNRYVLKQDGRCRDVLLRYANFFGAMVQQHAACNATHPVDQRMCRWILQTHDRVQLNEFPLTQEYLALMLGVRRPTVSHFAQVLRLHGLINYSRGNIQITSRQGLEACTCDCYQIIKSQGRRIFVTE